MPGVDAGYQYLDPLISNGDLRQCRGHTRAKYDTDMACLSARLIDSGSWGRIKHGQGVLAEIDTGSLIYCWNCAEVNPQYIVL